MSLPRWENGQKRPIIDTVLNHYCDKKFERILDIGAGTAMESQYIQKHHNSEIWILEGNNSNNKNKSSGARKGKWNDSKDDFLYYWNFEDLKAYHANGTQQYHLLDCDNFTINRDVKFDLICSWLSCGFHYPVSIYRDLIKTHSHANTKLVFDLRMNKGSITSEPGIGIRHVFNTFGRKVATCEIFFEETAG